MDEKKEGGEKREKHALRQRIYQEEHGKNCGGNIQKLYKMENERVRRNLPREQIGKALHGPIIGDAVSQLEFPNTARDYFGKMRERMNVFIPNHLPNVVMHKSVLQRCAIEQKHKKQREPKHQKQPFLVFKKGCHLSSALPVERDSERLLFFSLSRHTHIHLLYQKFANKKTLPRKSKGRGVFGQDYCLPPFFNGLLTK
jgi:hypothetical protein